jgi:8-oxo-dGTP diphosphatase
MSSRGVVHAAGGIISRQGEGGEIEVLLIHRPRRQDWTFPKGKLEAGETHEACALREVEEETALRCVLGRELATTSHQDGKGRLKIVRYWMMDPAGGVAEPRNEVDGVRWVSLEDAASLLTYSGDRELLAAFSSQVASSR